MIQPFLLLLVCAPLIHGASMVPIPALANEPRSPCEERKPIPLRDRNVYVALGHSVTLKCEALELIRQEGVNVSRHPGSCAIERAQWSMPGFVNGSESTERILWSTPVDNVNAKNHFVMGEDYSLSGFFLQPVHNSSFDCHVLTKQADYVSRINVILMDCDPSIELYTYRNLRNPCKYGGCLVDTVDEFKVMRCQCAEQYTGEFCDVRTDGALWREFVFYSPMVGHCIGVALMFIVNNYWNSSDTVPRISLAAEVPDTGKPTEDLCLLYPAAYLKLTPEQLRDPPKKTS